MKITRVTEDRRSRALAVETAAGVYAMPFAMLRLVPTREDPIAELFVDRELGNEAFTYRLCSGAEDSVHIDAVLDANTDPAYLQQTVLHELTIEAMAAVEESGLGIRQIARQLRTSPSQLYRLLDPANTNKSLGQMLALLHLAGRDVRLVVKPKESDQPRKRRVQG